MPQAKARRTRKPQSKKKKVPNNKQLATRIKKLEHTDELKYHDTQVTTSTYNNTGTIWYLSNPAQGDDFNNRVGEAITAKFLDLKIRSGNLVDAEVVMYRAVLFWDLSCAGVGPSMLSSVTSNVTSVIDDTTITSILLAPRNQRTKGRYHILMDKVWAINPNSSQVSNRQFLKKNFKLGGAKITYNGSSSNISAATGRGLFLWVYSTGPLTDLTNTVSAARLFYTDD